MSGEQSFLPNRETAGDGEDARGFSVPFFAVKHLVAQVGCSASPGVLSN